MCGSATLVRSPLEKEIPKLTESPRLVMVKYMEMIAKGVAEIVVLVLTQFHTFSLPEIEKGD